MSSAGRGIHGLRVLLLPAALALLACDEQQPPDDAAAAQHPMPPPKRDAGTPKLTRPMPDAGRLGAGHVDSGDDDAGIPAPAQCPVGVCDLRDPGSCPTDEGCVLTQTAEDAGVAPQCVSAGPGLDGDACMQTSDCVAGLDCTAFDGSGTCRRYCCQLNRTEGCPEGQYCRVGLRVEMSAAGASLCDRCDACDPRAVDACGSGLACYPLPGTTACTACLPAGSSELGGACTLSNDCTSGSACFRLGRAPASCVAFCDLEGTSDCKGDATCKAVTGAALPPGLGLCL